MRKLFTAAAAVAFMALSVPAFAQGGGNPGVSGNLSVTPRGDYAPYVAAPRAWRPDPYWRNAPRGQGLPRYAQSVPDNYWPGPQGWQYTPGPL